MDSNSNPDQRTSPAVDWFLSMSRRARAAVVISVVLILVVLLNANVSNQKESKCSLLGKCRLTSAEIDRIEITLGKSGFGEFDVSDGVILVPEKQRANLLKKLAEENALPTRFDPDPSSQNLNPFFSHSQRAVMERQAKKKQMETMLGRLPFIEQAWFEMDSARPTNAFQPTQYSAIVSVKATGRRNLDANQVLTIRQIVAGAFAAIEPDDIVITDLNAGRAFQRSPADGPAGTEQTDQWELLAADRQRYYEDEIRRALAEFPGVLFELEYELDVQKLINEHRFADSKRRIADNNIPSIQQQTFLEPRNPQQIATTASISFSTNGQAEIESIEKAESNAVPRRLESSMPILRSSQRMPAMETSPNLSRIARLAKENGTLAGAEHVSVIVHVPHSIFGEDCQPSAVGLLGRQHKQDREALLAKFETLRSQIVARLTALLPVSSFDTSGTPIVVSLDRSVTEQPAAKPLASIQSWFADNWASICVVLIGTMLVVIVTRLGVTPLGTSEKSRASAPRAAEPNPNGQAKLPTPEELAAKEVAEQRLVKMIEADPDTAARVIQSWIRDAA